MLVTPPKSSRAPHLVCRTPLLDLAAQHALHVQILTYTPCMHVCTYRAAIYRIDSLLRAQYIIYTPHGCMHAIMSILSIYEGCRWDSLVLWSLWCP